MNCVPERMISIEAEAAKRVLQQIREAETGDLELEQDAIEGETSLLEAIEAAMSEIDECDVLTAGLAAKIDAFEARKKQIEARQERLRAAIEQAMLLTEKESLRLTTATVSLRRIQPKLIVSNEADIPAKFWIEQERPAPKLDKKALAEAVKAGEKIPGATLDNGGFSIAVRRK